jgi:peptide/nickel transport system substrate-binding protein
MKRFQAIAGAITIVLAAGVARPAGAENVLRWASATDPLTYDPHSANNFPTVAANLQAYEPLVDFNSRSEIEPALAVDWRLIDSTTWQFHLRQGVRFYDGTPFTSEDVIFSLKWGTSTPSDSRTAVSPMLAVEAVDDHTVRITTGAPNPILPEQLASIPITSKRWAELAGR